MKRVVPALVAVGFLLDPAISRAQGTPTLSGLLLDQFLQNIVLAKTPEGEGVAAHTPTFVTDAALTSVTALVQQVSQQIASQVSNAPIGSSSSGFTYRYDSAL